MNKRVSLYFFGEIGVYDEYCPAYVGSKDYVAEILYLIAENKPFEISKEEIMEILNIDLNYINDIIFSLKRVALIDEKDNYYKVNFPIFLEKDLEIIDKTLSNIGKIVGDIIIRNKEIIYSKLTKLSNYKFYTKERLLYHIICDYIFDGTSFDYFNEKGLFCTSKGQPGNRDYIAIAYEDNEVVETYSDKLLCSSNNFRGGSFTFNSFGDSNGDRKDMYRFFRITEKSLEDLTNSKDLNLSYVKIIHRKNREIAKQCGEVMLKILNSKLNYLDLSDSERELAILLKKLNYIDFNEETEKISIKVPIFIKKDMDIIKNISDFILNETFETVRDTFIEFEKNATDLSAIKHRVNIKEISNEVWHQIFGNINEYLAKVGFVSNPKYIEGEGRYLQSLSIDI